MANKIDEYINKQQSPQKEICQALRQLILKTFPGVKEEMKWGVPAFDDGKFYIVALKKHVNLGFSKEELTREELKLFDGEAKTTVHIEVCSAKVDTERIIRLLELVHSK
jgi:uncharacterized protein YdhG (YjbR/CyaY superfamily)